MRPPHYLGFARALVFAGLGGCATSAGAPQSVDPGPGPGCPARAPTEGAACSPAATCRYYSGPPEQRSLSAQCVCQPSPTPPALVWSCQRYQNRGPLPPPELPAAA